ncbi:Aste57867_8641 [Aphanomyces stellatus]|uniref:Aste57867_8641 protein n=1 Tax=Aphanomyces stellatus TaxID=120398 RepID=A0A485KL05_9STRA|nr:hypothetical protein As57867_008607 [Aphanomyces stellatus]VFT85527.1 Aste57867_8641 [Aphanomyces stellatus]
MEDTSEDLDLELLIAANKKLKKEDHARRMVQFRQNKKVQVEVLQKTIAKLQSIKKSLVQDQEERQGLPWSEVARALLEVQKVAESNQVTLRSRLQQHEALVKEMYQWVSAYTAIQKSPNPPCHTWRNVSLLSNPTSRRLGKDWILKQMHHNTDRMFQQHGFKYIADDFVVDRDMRISFTDGEFTVCYRAIVDVPDTLNVAVAHINNTLLPLRCYIVDFSPDIPLILNDVSEGCKQFVLTTPMGEYVNVLVGEFYNTNRCTLVLQQIQNDETFEDFKSYRQRNRTEWLDLHQMPNGRTVFRMVAFYSQSYTQECGSISFLDDARNLGIDLGSCPEKFRESRFKHILTSNVAATVHTNGY